MNRCPKCQEELVSDSVICPNCGHVLDENNASADMDSELEKFSQMIYNMENSIDDEFSTPSYDPNDIEKILNGEISEVIELESLEDEVLEEPLEETLEEVSDSDEDVNEEKEEKVFTFTPSSFTATEPEVEELTEEEIELEPEISEIYPDSPFEAIEESEEVEQDSVNEEGSFGSSDSEEELDKIFADMSQYTEEIVDSDNDFITNISSAAIDYKESELLKQVNELRDEIIGEDEVRNIDREVDKFLSEIENTPFDEEKDSIKSAKYLQLNFVTTDKFATLISSENEKSDNTVIDGINENSGRITDIFGIETIIIAEKLSDSELESTIEAVNIQKEEIIHSLEQEEKDIQHSKYMHLRDKMISVVKVGAIIGLLFIIIYLFCYIFDIGFFKMENKLYTPVSIEKYDNIIYSSLMDMSETIDEVINKFDEYEKGNVSKEDMIEFCNESMDTFNKYKIVFDKDIYDEADDYVFEATNAFFFAYYYIENISKYVETDDEYYLNLNSIANLQKAKIISEVEDAREEFLLSVGYTEDEIKILDYKAGNKE